MSLRTLGKDGPSVPAIGLGLMSLSQIYGSTTGDDDMFALLDRAHAIGARFWDTSSAYGRSEEIAGHWLAKTGKRSDIFLATKFGYAKGHRGFDDIDSSAENCKRTCEESLKSLQTEWIDLCA